MEDSRAGLHEQERLLQIAGRQRLLVVFYLLLFAVTMAKRGASPDWDETTRSSYLMAQGLATILAYLGCAIANILLNVSVFSSVSAVILSILAPVPVLNFLTMLLASMRASRLLKAAGVRTGFVWTSDQDVLKLKNT